MNERISKNHAIDLNAMEDKIQQRLQRGKTKLLISHILCFILAVIIIFSMI